MIDFLNADVAFIAMGASWRSVDQTFIAEPDVSAMRRHTHGVLTLYCYILSAKGSEKAVVKGDIYMFGFLVVVKDFWDDSRIDEWKNQVQDRYHSVEEGCENDEKRVRN